MSTQTDAIATLLYVFCTLFAGCLGSFSNVVIYRVPNHMSIAYPPSTCPKCGARIRPYDNIPVLSWLILRGKCRQCKNPISVQYPIVEAVCAIFGFFLCRQIFMPHIADLLIDGVFWRLFLLFFSMLVFCVGCLALSIIDIQKTEIPPEIAIPIAIIGMTTAFIVPDTWPFTFIPGNIDGLDSVIGACIGAGIIILIIAVYYAVARRIGMGGGDIWMLAMIGACLGWQSLPFIFLASSLQGIITAIVAIILGKKQQNETQNGLFRNAVLNEINQIENDAEEPENRKLALPYGPFLALASVEYVFFGQYLLPLVTGGMLTPWGSMF